MDCAEENETKIDPNKSKAISFTEAQVKDPLNYSLGTKRFLKLAVANVWESSYEVILVGLIR